jgi:hypothetical protein
VASIAHKELSEQQIRSDVPLAHSEPILWEWTCLTVVFAPPVIIAERLGLLLLQYVQLVSFVRKAQLYQHHVLSALSMPLPEFKTLDSANLVRPVTTVQFSVSQQLTLLWFAMQDSFAMDVLLDLSLLTSLLVQFVLKVVFAYRVTPLSHSAQLVRLVSSRERMTILLV